MCSASKAIRPSRSRPAGQQVIIRRNCNLSTGGTAADVTDLVHPEVAARAVEAAKMVGLDVAGVDVDGPGHQPVRWNTRAGSWSKSTPAPACGCTWSLRRASPRPVGEAIIDAMFADGQNGRIPVVAVTGVNGKTTTTRFIAHLLRSTGRKVGMTCTDGIYIDNRRVDGGDCSGPVSAQSVLANPLVEAAVLETARGGILRAGLGFDRCDVAVVTNIGEGDHLGLADIETLEKLAKVKRCIVDVVPPEGHAVLKADDPHVAADGPILPGQSDFLRSLGRRSGGRRPSPGRRQGGLRPARHDRAGRGRKRNSVGLAVGRAADARRPDPVPGRKHAWPRSAAAWALGIPRDLIRAGLESFSGDMDKVPGRFNLLEIGGATVIVDYGHNASALQAMIEAIEQFPHRQRTAVYTAAGDRRDCDMVRQGELLGDAFDRVILYEDHYVRGREKGEIMGLLRRGMADGDRVTEIEEIHGAVKAVEAALRSVRPGELLLVQADEIDETVNFVKRYLAATEAGREIGLIEAIDVPATSVPTSGATVYAAPAVD